MTRRAIIAGTFSLVSVLVAACSTGTPSPTAAPAPPAANAPKPVAPPLPRPTPTAPVRAVASSDTPSVEVAAPPAPVADQPTATVTSRPSASGTASQAVTPEEQALLGPWRTFSARLFYDAGGASPVAGMLGLGDQLFLASDGSWRFGSSAGRWAVAAITASDWQKWRVKPYGPTRKVVFAGWNHGVADGPVEEDNGRVDFFWVIFRVAPPTVSAPGQVDMKFGHA